MSNCPNCRTRLTCGCQRRTATDGKQACSNCVSSYNTQLLRKQQKATGAQAAGSTNNPTNVRATYNGPGVQLTP